MNKLTRFALHIAPLLLIAVSAQVVAQADAGVEKSALERILSWFGFDRVPSAVTIMGSSSQTLTDSDLWEIGVNGAPSRLVVRGGSLRSPLACLDSSVYAVALGKDGLTTLNHKYEIAGSVQLSHESKVPKTIIACRKDTVGLLWPDGRVTALQLQTNTTEELGSLDNLQARDLIAASRSCGSHSLTAVIVGAGDQASSEVVVFDAEQGTVVKELTSDLPMQYKLDPAFTADCSKVLFAASPSAQSTKIPSGHPGCGCIVGERSQRSGLAALALAAAALALVFFRRRRRHQT